MASCDSPKPQHFWTDEETEFMLQQLKEFNILKYLDGRKTRNGAIFKKVAQRMHDAGFKRSSEQIRVRWKHLKQTYYGRKSYQSNGDSPDPSCAFGELLEEILGRRPLAQPAPHGVDIGLSSSVSEKQRQYRQRRDADPEKRKNHLEKERERSRKDKGAGKKTSISELNEREKKAKRKYWREAQAKSRGAKVQLTATCMSPPRSPEPAPQPAKNSQTGTSRVQTSRVQSPPQRSSSPQFQRPTSSPTIPEPRILPTGRRRGNATDLEVFFQRMERMQQSWMEQIRQSQDREERLVNSIIESNASVVSAIMEGLHSLRPSMSATQETYGDGDPIKQEYGLDMD